MTNAEQLRTSTEGLVTALRDIGLYEDQVQIGDDERAIVHLNLFIGGLAFSPRVQSPEMMGVDTEFRKMKARFNQEQFEETRRKIGEEGI